MTVPIILKSFINYYQFFSTASLSHQFTAFIHSCCVYINRLKLSISDSWILQNVFILSFFPYNFIIMFHCDNNDKKKCGVAHKKKWKFAAHFQVESVKYKNILIFFILSLLWFALPHLSHFAIAFESEREWRKNR